MADIVISEYGNDRRGYAVIQFTCNAAPECGTAAGELESPKVPPTVTEDATEQGEVGENEDEGRQQSQPMDIEEKSDEGEEDEELRGNPAIDLKDPTTFPLAKAFVDPSSFVGKQIRFAFAKGSTNPKKKFVWVWPAVVHFLAGRTAWHNNPAKHHEWKEPLDVWAIKTKGFLASAKLVEKKLPSGALEWSLSRREPSANQAIPAFSGPLPIIKPSPNPQQALPPSTTTTTKRDRGDEVEDIESRLQELSLAKEKLKTLEAAEVEALDKAKKAKAEAKKATAEANKAKQTVIELQDELVAHSTMEPRKRRG
ncbi:hypothetical protein G7Y79_00032g066630 [Physcia stellaris]|nr:hypothetical protein G7Y79_00032g066630 [Physcia stellaris]